MVFFLRASTLWKDLTDNYININDISRANKTSKLTIRCLMFLIVLRNYTETSTYKISRVHVYFLISLIRECRISRNFFSERNSSFITTLAVITMPPNSGRKWARCRRQLLGGGYPPCLPRNGVMIVGPVKLMWRTIEALWRSSAAGGSRRDIIRGI